MRLLPLVLLLTACSSPPPDPPAASVTQSPIEEEPTCDALCARAEAEACAHTPRAYCDRNCAAVMGHCEKEMRAFIRCALKVEMICHDEQATTLGCTGEASAVDTCFEM
jgi:hypothetical protein